MIPLIRGKSDEVPLVCSCGAASFLAIPIVKICYSRYVEGRVGIDQTTFSQFRCAGCMKMIDLKTEVERQRSEPPRDAISEDK